MRSGELARLVGVSSDALRHYERLGLLPRPQRTAANYREYAPNSQQRVALIRRAVAIGFSLTELKDILAVRDQGGTPCLQVRSLMRSKIRDMDQQIRKLVSQRKELKRMSKDWDKRLRETQRGQAARLLESVPPRACAKLSSTFLKREGK
jgi:DNA-binding transcriptional MerR regulator